MNSTIRNILAVLAGAIVGMLVNGALISISSTIIAPPDGADVTTLEGLKASLHLFQPRHFVMPFLAHALGTLSGALLALLIVQNNKTLTAYIIAGLFFIGGAMNVYMLPAPMWFNVLDLVVAYFPMAWLALFISSRK